MLLTKLNNQYTAKEDKITFPLGFFFVSLAVSWGGTVLEKNNYYWFLFPSLFLILYFSFVTMQHFAHKSKIKRVQEDFSHLRKIIESNKLSPYSSQLDIKRIENDFYVEYEIDRGPWAGAIAEFVYNKEENILSEEYFYSDARKYFKEEAEEILDSIKDMIFERERKGKFLIQNLEVMKEEKAEYKDEIIKKINDSMTQSQMIAKKNETLLSLEDKHTLVSSIPADLKEVKELYLSFSDESKEKNKEKIKRTTSVLEKRIISISMNMEKIKEEKLEFLEQKIVKKHSS